jgi:hypothetical protein
MAKSGRFTGDKSDVEWLHDDLLRHHVVQGIRTFKFNINGRLLQMNVTHEDTDITRIKIELRDDREYTKYAPVFHRANAFA